MTEPTVVPPGTGEIIGDSAERRVEVLSYADQLHATWSRFAAGRDGADLHIHRRHTDLFYVLEGELTLRLGVEDDQRTVPAGTLARVPPMVVHGFRNASGADVRYLNMHAPGRGFIDYMRSIREQRPITYDQEPPPEDGEGLRPGSEAAIGGAEFEAVIDGHRRRLLCEVEELGIVETQAGGAGEIHPPHAHEDRLESWYVLEGPILFALGEREVEAEAGTWLQAPAGLEHTYEFTGPGARLLSIHTPSGELGAYLRGAATSASP